MKTMQANPIPSRNFDHFYATLMSLKRNAAAQAEKHCILKTHT